MSDVMNGEQLSEFLKQSRTNRVKGGHYIEPGLQEVMAKTIGEQSEFAQAMFEFGGVDALKGCVGYWDDRDAVHRYQIEHNVSGLSIRETTIAGKTFRHTDFDWQLQLLDSDLKVLEDSVPGVVNDFKSLAAGYHIAIEDAETEALHPIPFEQIDSEAAGATYAWLSEDSWEPYVCAEQGPLFGRTLCRNVAKLRPDSIVLHLSWGRPELEQCDRTAKIVAYTEAMRQEWGVSAK